MQRQQAERVYGVGVARHIAYHAFKLFARHLPVLLVDKVARVIEPHAGGGRITGQVGLVECLCARRVFFRGQDASLEQRHLFPVGAQRERLIDGIQPLFQFAGTHRQVCLREMRNRVLRVALHQRLHYLQRRGAVLMAAEHGSHAHESLVEIILRRLGRQDMFEFTLRLGRLPDLHQRRGQRFARLDLLGPQLHPQPGVGQRLRVALGVDRGQRGALGQARIACFACHPAQRHGCDRHLTTLPGDLAYQQAVKRIGVERRARQVGILRDGWLIWRAHRLRCFGGNRGAGRQPQAGQQAQQATGGGGCALQVHIGPSWILNH